MLVTPATVPLIRPEAAFMVAAVVLLDVHTPPVIVVVKVNVLPTHTFCVPPNTAAVGGAVTVTILIGEVAELQPPVPATV